MSDLFSAEILKKKYGLTNDEAHELSSLLNFFQKKNFTHSDQLNNYITNNNLSNQFPILTGMGIFQKNGNRWNLENALSKRFYGIVCGYLGLQNKESGATMVGFISNETKYNSNGFFPTKFQYENLKTSFVEDDEERYTLKDLVEIYGGNPYEMTNEEMELFLETQEPDFD